MTNWKEKLIEDHIDLQKDVETLREQMSQNSAIQHLTASIKMMQKDLDKQKAVFTDQITEHNIRIERLGKDLIELWDVEGNVYKCAAGTATRSTTKSVVIEKKSDLLHRLVSIVGDYEEAYETIKSFNLPAIRKYMNVELIAKDIAHFEEKQNITIKEVAEK